MNDSSNKPPKESRMKARNKNRQEAVKEIEYYLNQDGDDTQIIKNIAVSSVIPKVETYKKEDSASQDSLSGVPFFAGLEESLAENFGANPFWSFTMMVKEGGDHKLLFSSQEDAEELYTILLKED
jgi:hypothetical protein